MLLSELPPKLFHRGLSKKLKALSIHSVLTAEAGTVARAAIAKEAIDLFMLNLF